MNPVNTNKYNKLLAGVVAAALLPASGILHADVINASSTNAVNIDIQSQSIGSALRELAKDTGIQIIVPATLGERFKVPSIKGQYTLPAALDRMLEGTGLVYEFRADDSVVVKEKDISAKIPESKDNFTFVLEEVFVTAEKRTESLQNIPIAISAFSGEDMNRAGISGITDLKQLAPSLQVSTRGEPNISMRGVGQQLRNIGAGSGVVVSENGMPLAETVLFSIDFLDVERVEVLRGPQGTIAGRNATGGAINVYAKKPTETLEGGLKATVGNYSRFSTEGFLSGPIGESGVLGRFALRTNRQDGWLENVLLDEKVEKRDEVQARASFLAPLSDALQANLILEARETREAVEVLVEKGRLRPDTPSHSERLGGGENDLENLKFHSNHSGRVDGNKFKAILKVDWDIGSDIRLASTTGYARLDRLIDNVDMDGGGADYEFFPYVDFIIRQASQELTLTADLSDQLDMILGAIYLRSRAEMPIDIALPINGIPPGSLVYLPNQELDSWAVYSQWRYHLTDNLRIAIGGRYTDDGKVSIQDRHLLGEHSIAEASESWSAFTPRVALDYAPTDDTTFYASISRGFKSGGLSSFQLDPNDPSRPDSYDPEYVWSYEAGAKIHWLNRRLRTALAVFYMDYTDFQAGVRVPVVGGPPVGEIKNAGEATVKGVELELEAQISDEFKLVAASSWIDARFDVLETSDAIFPELNDPITGVRDLSGNRIPRAPEWQFNISGEYLTSVGTEFSVILRADYQWQSKQFFHIQNYEAMSQDAYGLLNLSAALETVDGRWHLSIFTHNAFDKRYMSDTRDLGQSVVGVIGVPRMYGIRLGYNF